MGLDATSGAERWRHAAPPDVPLGGAQARPGAVVMSHVDADDATVFVPAWGASVSAVDLRTGAVRWAWVPGPTAGDTAAAGRFRSGAQGVRVSGDTVFATAWHALDAQGLKTEPWVVALDKGTGRELWRVVLPQYTGGLTITGAPALHRDLVVVTSVGGHAWAIDRTTRQVAWHHVPQTQFATFAGAAVYDGTV